MRKLSVLATQFFCQPKIDPQNKAVTLCETHMNTHSKEKFHPMKGDSHQALHEVNSFGDWPKNCEDSYEERDEGGKLLQRESI